MSGMHTWICVPCPHWGRPPHRVRYSFTKPSSGPHGSTGLEFRWDTGWDSEVLWGPRTVSSPRSSAVRKQLWAGGAGVGVAQCRGARESSLGTEEKGRQRGWRAGDQGRVRGGRSGSQQGLDFPQAGGTMAVLARLSPNLPVHREDGTGSCSGQQGAGAQWVPRGRCSPGQLCARPPCWVYPRPSPQHCTKSRDSGAKPEILVLPVLAVCPRAGACPLCSGVAICEASDGLAPRARWAGCAHAHGHFAACTGSERP